MPDRGGGGGDKLKTRPEAKETLWHNLVKWQYGSRQFTQGKEAVARQKH